MFNEFKSIISANCDEIKPSFREIKKSRKFFSDTKNVENFWKSLWCKQYTGNPNAKWLEEIEQVFTELIPIVHDGEINITQNDVTNFIKKKRNWSSPGPDLIVNFWYKKISSIHTISTYIFSAIINSGFAEEKRFFSRNLAIGK